MKKLLKILFAIEFILILVIIALSLIGKPATTAYAVKENPNIGEIKFKVLTKAVCEEKSNHVFCRDELFVKCDGKEYLVSNEPLNDMLECNGIKINLSDIKANGDTEFKKGWIDPRNNP